MKNSKIEWTGSTYNPIIVKGGGFYCFKVSPACKHCYAENMARRVATMQGNEAEPYTVRDVYPELELKRGMLAGWAKKKNPERNFVSSMTDIFGEFVPDEWVFEILDAEAAAPIQIFQNLTKRAKRCHELIHKWLQLRGLEKLPDNIWIGFSTENQQTFSERVLWLIDIPAKVRFISCEPLLSNINMWPYLRLTVCRDRTSPGSAIDWIIVGGESGNRKTVRPMQLDWAISIMNQAKAAGVPFFFKQWGDYIPVSQAGYCEYLNDYPTPKIVEINGCEYYRLGKHNTGAIIEGQSFKQFPNS